MLHVFKPKMSQWVKNKLAYLPRSTPKPGPMGGNRPRPASKLQQGTYFYLKTIINLSQTLFVKTKLATIHHCIFALAQGLPTSLPGTEPLQKARKFKTTFSPYKLWLWIEAGRVGDIAWSFCMRSLKINICT